METVGKVLAPFISECRILRTADPQKDPRVEDSRNSSRGPGFRVLGLRVKWLKFRVLGFRVFGGLGV